MLSIINFGVVGLNLIAISIFFTNSPNVLVLSVTLELITIVLSFSP